MSEPAEVLVQPDGPAVAGSGLLVPLRRPAFRWLVAGQMLSTFGGLIFTVALPFIVLRHGDVGDLTVLLLVLGLARIVGAPVGGLLADRWQPKRVMLVADLARAVVLFGLILVTSSGEPGLLQLTIAVGLLGVLDGLFVPAYWAMTPTVLASDELTAGNAVGESLMIVAVIVGPLVGGLAMVSLPATAVIGVNALTFVVSAATLLKVRTLVPPRFEVTPSVEVTPPFEDTPAGPEAGRLQFREFARGSRLFIAMLVMTAILHLTSAGVVSIALPVFADENFPDGQRVFGLLLGAEGGGLLVGTIVAGLTARMTHRGYLAVGLLLVHGLVLTMFGRIPGLPPLLVGMAIIGLVSGTLSILVLTLLQQISPEHLRGRVMGAFTSVSIGSYPISVIILGFVVTHGGTRSAFLVGGIGVIAVALTGLAQRAVRTA